MLTISEKILGTTLDRVREVLSEHLPIKPEQVVLEAAIEGDLGADSLDCVEICMALEEEFRVSIDDDQLRGLVTVGDAVRLIDHLPNDPLR